MKAIRVSAVLVLAANAWACGEVFGPTLDLLGARTIVVRAVDSGALDAGSQDGGPCRSFDCFWDGGRPVVVTGWTNDAGCKLASFKLLPGFVLAGSSSGMVLLLRPSQPGAPGFYDRWTEERGAEPVRELETDRFVKPTAIGADGTIVGYSSEFGNAGAFRTGDGGIVRLPSTVLGLGGAAVPAGISRSGLIMGVSGQCAAAWRDNSFFPLAPGTCLEDTVVVAGVSDVDTAVGGWLLRDYETPRSVPVVWYADGGSELLNTWYGWSGTAFGVSPNGKYIIGTQFPLDVALFINKVPVGLPSNFGVTGVGVAVNDRGWAVGVEEGVLPFGRTNPSGKRAVFWRDGENCNINELLLDAGVFPFDVRSISEDGLIAGNAELDFEDDGGAARNPVAGFAIRLVGGLSDGG